jgi:hypothetical protein
MRTILFVLLVLLASTAFSQIAEQWVWYGTASTSWHFLAKDTTKAYVKTLQFEVISDDSDGDTLWVALGADTTAGKIWPMLQGESMFFPSTYVAGIRIKASDSVPYRVRLY